MITRMTEEQRRAIREHAGEPVYVLDDQTQARYVLLPAGDYDERLKSKQLSDEEIDEQLRSMSPDEQIDVSEMYPLIDEALREVWDDPAMDIYNDYDGPKR